MFRTAEMTDTQIWQMGYREVEQTSARRVRARGECAAHIIQYPLSLDVNGSPFPRHADIIGWSTDLPEDRLQRATEIADAMMLHIDPRP